MIMKKNTSKTVFHLNVDDRQCNSKKYNNDKCQYEVKTRQNIASLQTFGAF